MSTSSVKLTREQLYEEVWKTPIHRLSVKYGLSDVGLAKACKRMDIPRPPRGYWRRKEVGARVKQIPLPEPKDGAQLEIEFRPVYGRAKRGWKTGGRGDQSSPYRLEVSEFLQDAHPLIDSSKSRLEALSENKSGLLITKVKRCLDLQVSRNHLDRCLRLLDAIFKEWEEKGNCVAIGTSGDKGVTVLRAGEEEIQLSIVEEVKEFEIEPTKEELLHPKWTWKKRSEIRPTGKLTIHLSGDYIANGRTFHRRYSDGQKAPIEMKGGRMLDAALQYLEERGAYLEEKEREREAWREQQRLWAIERKKQEEESRKREEERRRVREFLDAYEKWTESQRVRAFIEACKLKMAAELDHSEFEPWVEWATQIADQKDPLCNGYPASWTQENRR